MSHAGGTPDGKPWTFLTNHARVLTNITRNPSTRLRDIAAAIGITERAAQTIVNDLEEAGYITRTKVGRRNHYSVDPSRPFRHPADADHRIEGLLALFTDHDHDTATASPAPQDTE
ncbi:winged helix-turn-helix domain-containing protein [Actinoallomurus purpureus]|uniref:helix-turn-helix transcriptional regulator n=1 Tax=Actinoallomurus purpureus TaxID=478114 RepID=UPI0020931C8E|nr:winged helix-turn-helix domain-containing protein [Actinoallomurus purpureus]MCO6009243.1 winged helix-turn-helix domain-containing protein [Actinoallomurus purpureus]